jgi:hypothetical protein
MQLAWAVAYNNQSDLDLSVMRGWESITRVVDLLLISNLYNSMWLFLGYVLNGALCMVILMFTT